MQIPAQIVARKQLLQTIGLTSAAFLVALPVGAAVLGSNGGVAGAQGTTTTVTKSVEDLGSCTTGTAQKATTTTTKTTHGVSTVRQTGGSGINQNGTGNQASQNGSGATAQASDHSIAVAASLLNDVIDVNNVLNGNTVSVPVTAPVSVPVTAPVLGGLLGGLGL